MGTGAARRAARRNARDNGGNEIVSGESKQETESAGNDKGSGNSPTGKAGKGRGSSAKAEGTNSGNETGSQSGNSVNPASLVDDIYERDENGEIVLTAAGKPRKKRGRRPGSTVSGGTTKRASNKGATVGVEMLAAQFQILNTGIAFLTKFDDFRLSDEEALQMSQATANVMEQFDYVPDPKVAAVLGLVTTTGMVYGPRIYLYRSHLKQVREEKKAQREVVADELASKRNEMSVVYPNSGSQFSG